MLELTPAGGAYYYDRMVFGLSVGSLALTSVLAAIRELVESLVADEARKVGLISVMDDFLFIGSVAAVAEYQGATLDGSG